ncbi:DUF2334 domain-containing protein [Vibrio parahaemolyticus]|nr:DUF2334 domain-containing protein [Vibrio parahaemolyticus]
MLINIRDDDTNYFTKPKELERAYGSYLEKIPITLACTPFVSKHSFLMDEIPGDRPSQFRQLREIEDAMNSEQIADMNRVYPLGDNKDLVEFLIPKVSCGKLEIALHGYNHRFYDNGAEFIKDHVNYYNVKDGKNYFEKLFNTSVTFFVPPSNKINLRAYQFLKSNNLELLTSGVIDCDTYWEKLYHYCQILVKSFKSYKSVIRKQLVSNPVYFGRNRYFRSRTFKVNDSAKDFLSRNSEYMEKNGFISIATHYTNLCNDELNRKEFFDLIELLKIKYPDCEFVTAQEIVQRKFKKQK